MSLAGAALKALVLAVVATAIASGPAATPIRRYADTHASQGVAVDARFIYAVSNSSIVKFDKASGRQVAAWKGDPERYPHINSCAVIGPELICASSNYPTTPMTSTVEVFDPRGMTHLRSITLADAPGSLTWVDRKDGRWWAAFANYDGKGGVAGRDHRATALVAYDASWRPKARWRFPEAVLDRFSPRSTSGGGWGDDGLLYVTGHDRAELYALRVPSDGGELELVDTLAIAAEGQAIAWDKSASRVLFGISRASGEVLAMRIPPAKTLAR
ncbi:hypothetical protein BH11PSE2_BH11PSE2_03130 [soil metagenome]